MNNIKLLTGQSSPCSIASSYEQSPKSDFFRHQNTLDTFRNRAETVYARGRPIRSVTARNAHPEVLYDFSTVRPLTAVVKTADDIHIFETAAPDDGGLNVYEKSDADRLKKNSYTYGEKLTIPPNCNFKI